ncbi:unnamed protein product [Pylaiella littoralis]
MMGSGNAGPSDHTLRREVSMFLRAAEEPDTLTFKQVRLAVEKSLGLPEDSLHKGSKAKIKEAVHSVMDELDQDKNNQQEEKEEEEEMEAEFDGVRLGNSSVTTTPPPAGCRSKRNSEDISPTKSAKKRRKVGNTSSAGFPDAANGSGGENRSRDVHDKQRNAACDGGEGDRTKDARIVKNKKIGSGKAGGGGSVEDNTLVCVISNTNRDSNASTLSIETPHQNQKASKWSDGTGAVLVVGFTAYESCCKLDEMKSGRKQVDVKTYKGHIIVSTAVVIRCGSCLIVCGETL